MFCKECGTENNDESLHCSNCNSFLRLSYSPLSGGERVKVVAFFLLLGTTFFFGIVPLIIALISIYVMKKDSDFTPIIKSKKYIYIYLITLALGGAVGSTMGYYDSNDYYKEYNVVYTPDGGREIEYYPEEQKIEFFKNLRNEAIVVAVISLVSMVFLASLIMRLFNWIYFGTLIRHREWILSNGIFSDEVKRQNQDNAIGIIGRDKFSSFSIADELIKWNDLFEKGLVSQDEYENAKQKLLNQE